MNELYSINIVDSTLRDGEQTVGVNFTREEKIEIAKMLSQVGVEIIEAGIPVVSTNEIDTLIELNNLNLQSTLLTWNRLSKKDIDASLKTGIKHAHISVPVSDIQINNKLRKDRKWVIKNLNEVLDYGLDNNLTISIGAEDASRADFKFLIDVYKIAEKKGVKRIRYADTISSLEPFSTFENIRRLKEEIACDIDFHGHNDFGLATANAYSAYRAGAKFISTCVNGIGERAGNTALEELISIVKFINKSNIKYNIQNLNKLSKIVEKASKIRISPTKPIVGKNVFSHSSGIHVDGLIKNKVNYEFLRPCDFGRKTKIVLGKFSGISSIEFTLKKRGVHLTATELKQCKEELVNSAYLNKKILKTKDMLALVKGRV